MLLIFVDLDGLKDIRIAIQTGEADSETVLPGVRVPAYAYRRWFYRRGS